jgi:hypothetical protein
MTTFRSLACLVLAAATPAVAQRPQQPSTRALPQYVQRFYDWYVPRAHQRTQHPAYWEALSFKASFLAHPLLRALRADSAAQAHAPGEQVGLDFDPFVNSQDPCERYEVGATTHRNQSYWVEVHGICGGRRHPTPDVTVDVVLVNQAWVFVDFHYPNMHTDLLAVLQTLHQARSAAAKARARSD